MGECPFSAFFPISYLCHNILALIATALDSAYMTQGMGLFSTKVSLCSLGHPPFFTIFFTNIYNKQVIK